MPRNDNECAAEAKVLKAMGFGGGGVGQNSSSSLRKELVTMKSERAEDYERLQALLKEKANCNITRQSPCNKIIITTPGEGEEKEVRCLLQLEEVRIAAEPLDIAQIAKMAKEREWSESTVQKQLYRAVRKGHIPLRADLTLSGGAPPQLSHAILLKKETREAFFCGEGGGLVEALGLVIKLAERTRKPAADLSVADGLETMRRLVKKVRGLLESPPAGGRARKAPPSDDEDAYPASSASSQDSVEKKKEASKQKKEKSEKKEKKRKEKKRSSSSSAEEEMVLVAKLEKKKSRDRKAEKAERERKIVQLAREYKNSPWAGSSSGSEEEEKKKKKKTKKPSSSSASSEVREKKSKRKERREEKPRPNEKRSKKQAKRSQSSSASASMEVEVPKPKKSVEKKEKKVELPVEVAAPQEEVTERMEEEKRESSPPARKHKLTIKPASPLREQPVAAQETAPSAQAQRLSDINSMLDRVANIAPLFCTPESSDDKNLGLFLDDYAALIQS